MTSPKVELEREDSLSIHETTATTTTTDDDPNSNNEDSNDDNNNNNNNNDDDFNNLPPGRMHATSGVAHQRLSSFGSAASSSSMLHIPPNLQQQAAAAAAAAAGQQQQQQQQQQTSKKHQHQQRDGGGGGGGVSTVPSATQTTTDANSSISSLEELVDQDILYDRQGLVELDLSESQRKLQMYRELGVNLPSVNERLSEETLDDCHAFSDVVRSSNASRVSQGTSGCGAKDLEPLDECGEETDDEDLDAIHEEEYEAGGEHHQTHTQPTVILTNMENLTLQHDADDASSRGAAAGGVSRTDGESSLGVEEAPSGRTA